MDNATKNYEIGFLAKSEEDKEEIARVLKLRNASIAGPGLISRIRLAYPIKKETAAFFGCFYFSAEPSAISEIKSDLKTSKKILRTLIVFAPEKKYRPERAGRPLPQAEPPAVKKPEKAVEAIDKPKPAFFAKELSNEELEKKLKEVLDS